MFELIEPEANGSAADEAPPKFEVLGASLCRNASGSELLVFEAANESAAAAELEQPIPNDSFGASGKLGIL